MVRDKLNERELEEQRKQAVEVLERGYGVKEVADIFDVASGTVHRWKKTYDETGIEGLESSHRRTGENVFLDEISADYLREVLTEIENKKSIQQVMTALNYKEESGVTQKELAERYDYSQGTISDWLNRVAKLATNSHEDVFSTTQSDNNRSLPEDKLPELKNILKNNPQSYGFESPRWTMENISKIIQEEFDIKVTSRTASKYVEEIDWKGGEQKSVNIPDNRKRANGKYIPVDNEELVSTLNEIVDRPTQRIMAIILYNEGFSVPTISNLFDISEGTIYKWLKRLEQESIDELIYDDSGGGRSPKLPESKRPKLEEILREGPEEQGFTGQIWTSARVAEIIDRKFGISVHRVTAWKYLRELGWSNKKPQRIATERDEDAIEEFRNEEWKMIQTRANIKSHSIVFVDETKFRLLPTIKKTWAPKGERATIETSGLFEYIAVIGAIIYTPETHSLNLQWKTQRYDFETESICGFLESIALENPQKTIFLLDNWSPHKTALEKLEEDLNETTTEFDIEWFPEYASGINPVDNVWGQAKYNELPNFAPENLEKLELKVKEALTEIQADEDLLRYFVEDAGLKIEE
jgi:transposase